jgi:deoxyribodipyrimidine photo-lyase
MSAPAIVWFRRNLRIADNSALAAACATGRPVLPVFTFDGESLGAASAWWLHHSLSSLDSALVQAGNRLRIYKGRPAEVLPRVIAASGAASLHYAASFEPQGRLAEAELDKALPAELTVETVQDYYLYTPGSLRTKSGAGFKVFTPFHKASLNEPEPARPLAPPQSISPPDGDCIARIDSAVINQSLDSLELLPVAPDWSGGLRTAWTPGEPSAFRALEYFLEDLSAYSTGRHRPDVEATSRLSPHLHFGELSPRQVWHAVNDAGLAVAAKGKAAHAFLRQLVWREFSGHLLYHFPTLPSEPLREEFRRFPWKDDEDALHAWQRGRTGVPIVDAGMRQLWETGWMHNRVRMIVASYLVKNLMIPWQHGAEWFFDTLVDADLANNSASWQWVAGCGTDAAPYFRIFNPVIQSRKFDPDGTYIRRWVPELAELPTEVLFEPWRADGLTRNLADLRYGVDYPEPLVDLGASRQQALDAYHELRNS